MDTWYLFTWLFLVLHVTLSDKVAGNCSYAMNQNTADCSQINLASVPDNLSSDIQVLDLSYNRIRELPGFSFQHYGSIKHLYLGNNLLSFVDVEAFTGLDQLKTVDLSYNALNTLPVGLLRLPALSRLSLSHNRLSALDLRDAPVSESLSQLSLGSCHLAELPDLRPVPNLQELNMSDNELTFITPRQLVPLCGLYLLDIRQNPELFLNAHPCDCYKLQAWVKHRNIFYAEEPLNCTLGEETVTEVPCDLKLPEINTTACKKVYYMPLDKKNMWVHWLLPTIIFVAIAFIIVMVAVTLVQSRRSRITKMEVRNRARLI